MIYKKKLLMAVIIALMSGVSILNAQVLVGPYIGVNLSTVTGGNSSGNSYRPGLNAGLAIDLGLSQNFLIETGLGYNMKGSGFDNTTTATIGNVNYSYENSGHTTFSYISLPVLAMLKFGNLFIQAGPDFSALVGESTSNTTTTTSGGTSSTVESSSSSVSGSNTIDYGLNFGLGLQSSQGAFIRLGSVIGLGNVDKASTSNTIHNLLFQLSFGWKFGSVKSSNG